MDLVELIKSRRSIRHFKQDVPPRAVIRECLEAASWAPNPTNQQPWHFTIATGKQLKEISGIILEVFPRRMKDIDPYRGIPRDCELRKNETFGKLLTAAKQAGFDPQELFPKNLTFYGAPVAVIFSVHKMENNLYRYATVAALENFLLAAHAGGLGTCWLSAVAACQDEIKPVLAIPDGMEILDGVGLGYPVQDSALNTYKRTRLTVDETATWIGFEE